MPKLNWFDKENILNEIFQQSAISSRKTGKIPVITGHLEIPGKMTAYLVKFIVMKIFVFFKTIPNFFKRLMFFVAN